jgi:hypothetical protein
MFTIVVKVISHKETRMRENKSEYFRILKLCICVCHGNNFLN